MITKINLNKVASYKNQTALITDKKVNLIYGLNGTGKSTLSNYLHQRADDRFKNCSVEGLDDNHEILVYNQTLDRKSTRLNSSHVKISYAVFCLKKKKNIRNNDTI